MITWRARAYKPCEAASSAVYLTNQAKSGTRRSPGLPVGLGLGAGFSDSGDCSLEQV